MPDKNLNVAIVGGGGYLGSKLTQKWLDNGNKVMVVDNLYFNQGPLIASVLLRENCEFVQRDAENLEESFLKQFDVLYLLQSYVGAPLCNSLSKEEVIRVNVTSSKKIVEKLSKNQRVISPCSNSGFGNAAGVCTEETPMKSLTLYGSSKEECERVVMEHPSASSTRLATVWGQSLRNRIDLMVNQFTYLFTLTNQLQLFQGDFNRNFVHIDDVVEMFFDISTDERTFGQVYNFGQDKDNTTKANLAAFIASKFEGSQITYLERKDPDTRNCICSSQKLAKIGHSAKITLETGIDKLIKFYELFPKYGTKDHEKIVSLMKNA